MKKNSFEDIKPFITPIVIGIGIYIFGSKVLEALGLKDSAADTQATQLGNKKYWDPGYGEGAKHGLTSASGYNLSEIIYNAIGYFTDDESAIIGVFRALNYQTQVSSLSYWYQKKYNKDLYNHLYTNLTSEEMLQIKQIIDKLPIGKI